MPFDPSNLQSHPLGDLLDKKLHEQYLVTSLRLVLETLIYLLDAQKIPYEKTKVVDFFRNSIGSIRDDSFDNFTIAGDAILSK